MPDQSMFPTAIMSQNNATLLFEEGLLLSGITIELLDEQLLHWHRTEVGS